MKVERLTKAVQRRSAAEARRIKREILRLRGKSRISEMLALDVATNIILAGDRTLRKRESDARTDTARRVLVGARVPRDFAQQCREEAERRGMSLYAWVVWALEKALERAWWE